VLWLPAAKALARAMSCSAASAKPLRVCPKSWLPRGVERAELASSLQPLLDLPVS